MPTDAQGRTISDDGQWWWDGGAWQPVKKGFFDTLADSVDDVVKKVEGSQATSGASSAATARSETSAPAMASASAAAPAPAPEPAPAPVAAAPAPAPVAAAPAPPAIPSADLLAYLGALRGAGVVSDAEFESIRRRIPGQA